MLQQGLMHASTASAPAPHPSPHVCPPPTVPPPPQPASQQQQDNVLSWGPWVWACMTCVRQCAVLPCIWMPAFVWFQGFCVCGVAGLFDVGFGLGAWVCAVGCGAPCMQMVCLCWPAGGGLCGCTIAERAPSCRDHHPASILIHHSFSRVCCLRPSIPQCSSPTFTLDRTSLHAPSSHTAGWYAGGLPQPPDTLFSGAGSNPAFMLPGDLIRGGGPARPPSLVCVLFGGCWPLLSELGCAILTLSPMSSF